MDTTGTPGNVNLLWDVCPCQTSLLPSSGQMTLLLLFMDSSLVPALSAVSAVIRHVQAEPGAAIKRPSLVLVEPCTVSWPYSHSAVLDDIPSITYVLDTFLKSHMVGVEGVLPLQ